MINVTFPDATRFAYISLDGGIWGPVNQYVFGAPNLAERTTEMPVGDEYIITTPSLVSNDNSCTHNKWLGQLRACPALIGSTSLTAQQAGQFYNWKQGYTSVRMANTQDGLVSNKIAPTHKLGFGSSDYDLWTDSYGPSFICSSASLLSGSSLHTCVLTAKPDYPGYKRLNRLLEFRHYIYDIESLQFISGTRYRINAQCWITSNRKVSFDLSSATDALAFSSLIESECSVSMSSAVVDAMIFWQGDVFASNLSGIYSAISDALIINKDMFSFPIKPESELVAEAIQSAKFVESNMIGFIRDMRHPTEMIPKLKNLKKLKDWASRYLSVKYGILPTVDDVKSIYAGFHKVRYLDKMNNLALTAGWSHTEASGVITRTHTRRLKMAVASEDNAVHRLYQNLNNIGIFPSLVNIWDLVPYSFVIDWLVDVGSILERIDQKIYYATLDIAYVTTSDKIVTTYSFSPSNTCPFVGTIIHKEYYRRVSDKCPAPALSGPVNTGNFNHYVEASALIVQRTH